MSDWNEQAAPNNNITADVLRRNDNRLVNEDRQKDSKQNRVNQKKQK